MTPRNPATEQADRPRWTVLVPEAHIAATSSTLARHMEELAQQQGGTVWRQEQPAGDAIKYQGTNGGDLPTWLEAIARDPEAANRLHRERHPEAYRPILYVGPVGGDGPWTEIGRIADLGPGS